MASNTEKYHTTFRTTPLSIVSFAVFEIVCVLAFVITFTGFNDDTHSFVFHRSEVDIDDMMDRNGL